MTENSLLRLSRYVAYLVAFTFAATFALPSASAQTAKERCAQYWAINAVEVRPGMWDYARRFYEAAWLPARREALKQGVIADYRLLAAKEHDKSPQVQLITIYRDKDQFDAREAHFAAIFKALSTPSPLKIDGKGRDEIFASLSGLEDYMDWPASSGCANNADAF